MPTPTTHIQSTTQEFIDIYDITNDLTIMKNGSCSIVITVDALNFGLLAEEEQDGIMYSYAGLLNSLNYPIQIVIRSQTKDATNYLNLIREQELRASSELKKSQIRAYAGFVADLIRERNVLDKKFYIVIPASALEMGLLPPSTVLPGVKQIDVSTIERSVIIDKARNILEPKRDHLVSQFGRIGLSAHQLNTQEIIQLFYTSYNPESAEGQQITNSNDYTTSLVSGQTSMSLPFTSPEAPPAPAEYSQPVVAPPSTNQPAQTYQPATTYNPAPTYEPATTPATPPIPTPVSMADPALELQQIIDVTAQQIPTSPDLTPVIDQNPASSTMTTTALTPSSPSLGDDLPPLPEI